MITSRGEIQILLSHTTALKLGCKFWELKNYFH